MLAGFGLACALLQPSPAALAQDEGPGVDASIRGSDLYHDSRDDRFRAPTGPVPAGTSVHVRLQAAAGDLSGVQLRLTDRLTGGSRALPMELVATDPGGGEFGYDYWQATVETGPEPDILE